MSRSGKQIAQENLQILRDWLRTRHEAGDWSRFERGGQLNKSAICEQLGFARSVFRQNPRVKKLLSRIELLLRTRGVLPPAPCAKAAQKPFQSALAGEFDAASGHAVEKRVIADHLQAQQRIKILEVEVTRLSAENLELREKIHRYQMIEDHMVKTGRMPRP